MTFIYKSRRPFEAPVKTRMLQDDGTFAETPFTGRFVILPEKEREAISEAAGGGDKGNRAVLMAAFVGWGPDLIDAGGNPIPYSDETKADLLGETDIFIAVNDTYVTGLLGREPLRAKN